MRKLNYLFIGKGRVSRHFEYYFQSLNIPVRTWSRRSSESLDEHLNWAERIVLSLRDDEIVNFYERHPQLHSKLCIHLSGSLTHPKIESAHPLMTFSELIYDPKKYQDIYFICEKNRHGFNYLFPDLLNKSFEVHSHEKAKYHALCAIMGNFSQIMWTHAASEFQSLGIQKEALEPYLKQILENYLSDGERALTGPLARGDQRTILKHLDALERNPLQNLYYNFIDLFQKQKRRRSLEVTHENPRL